jgi:hypothetical protein
MERKKVKDWQTPEPDWHRRKGSAAPIRFAKQAQRLQFRLNLHLTGFP